MSRLIYADNAATTQMDIAAFEAMKPFLTNEYGNASQLYAFARKPKKALQDARETIASCIGAAPEEIFFTSGGTESDNWAIKGSALLNAHNMRPSRPRLNITRCYILANRLNGVGIPLRICGLRGMAISRLRF